MCDGSQNAPEDSHGEERCQRGIRATPSLSWRHCDQERETLAEVGRGARLQQGRTIRADEFGQGRYEISTASALHHRLIAGELPVQGKARAADPEQRVKPEHTQSDFVDEPYRCRSFGTDGS